LSQHRFCPQADNDVRALLEMMLTFGQMMLCPADTNEKIQLLRVGFFVSRVQKRTDLKPRIFFN